MRPDAAAPLDAYLDFWLDHVRGRVRGRTWEGYEAICRIHIRPNLGVTPLADLAALDIQGLYAALLAKGLKTGSVLNTHLVLTNALKQAVRWGVIAANPADGAQPPRAKRSEPVVVDEDLSRRILAAAEGDRLECVIAFALATGMRRGEILGLSWHDIAKDGSSLQVRRSLQLLRGGEIRAEDPKTPRSRRSVLLPQFLAPYLKRHRQDQARRNAALGDGWVQSDVVVDRGDGQRWNPGSFGTAWVLFLKHAGLPRVRFHDLRHAHATALLGAGIHPKIVSERLGHSSVGITLDTYSHVLPTMQAEATAAFDAIFDAQT